MRDSKGAKEPDPLSNNGFSEPLPGRRRIQFLWLLVLGWMSIPYLALFVLGSVWLWQQGYLLYWLAALLTISITGGLGIRRLVRSASRPEASSQPDPRWTPQGRLAWEKVQELATQGDLAELPLDQPMVLYERLKGTVEAVARIFHPKSKNPLLEVPVPHLFRIAELVAADLRLACEANVPGSNLLTVADMKRFRDWSRWGPYLYRIYRVGMLAINPAVALTREIQGFIQGNVLKASALETKSWLARLIVERAGFYAIQLYSGQLAITKDQLDRYATEASKEQFAEIEERGSQVAAEPLRVVVVGQSGTGKTSLIRELFDHSAEHPGETLEIVPGVQTEGTTRYVSKSGGPFKQESQQNTVLIVDTQGYQLAADPLLREELLNADLVLFVLSAVRGARGEDRAWIENLRTEFLQRIDRDPPALAIVLTHIDLLRPAAEWSPPYDLIAPTTAKGKQILEAVKTVSEDLGTPLSAIIPVCLRTGSIYNVREGLAAAISEQLPEAERSRYQRAFQELQSKAGWDQLISQTKTAGRWLWNQVRRVKGEG